MFKLKTKTPGMKDSTPGDHKMSQDEDVSTKGHAELLEYVRDNVIGKDAEFHGPYGRKKVIYCDYVASGKPLRFIENYIRDYVLPFYANTHTTTNVSGFQTTRFRQDAREIIKKCVNASEDDVVIFCGSGATGCIHKLITALGLQGTGGRRTTIIVGPYEHHSNILPWKESGAKTERLKETFHGEVDLEDLETRIKANHAKKRRVIVAISAASNVTGIRTNTVKVSEVCHRCGALSVWDYAAGAPYLKIDMNPTKDGYKDAVFISPHKFVGGPGTPGVLVAKRNLFKNKVPVGCGGGTVVFVTGQSHMYVEDVEEREEGGTPAIIESIRAGMTFQLKQAIGPELIEHIEDQLVARAFSRWRKNKNILILGDQTSSRLPIFSFLVQHQESGKLLHQNFVSVLLNDLYGVQARGGCACAGPYAQDLLNMNEEMAMKFAWFLQSRETYEDGILQVEEAIEIMKPGFTRLNLPYFFDEQTIDYVIHAVDMVATHGWKLLPQYTYNTRTAEFYHYTQPTGVKISSLWDISYRNTMVKQGEECVYKSGLVALENMKRNAYNILSQSESVARGLDVPEDNLPLSEEHKGMVWFLLPHSAMLFLTVHSLCHLPIAHSSSLIVPRNLTHDRAHANWLKIEKKALQSMSPKFARKKSTDDEHVIKDDKITSVSLELTNKDEKVERRNTNTPSQKPSSLSKLPPVKSAVHSHAIEKGSKGNMSIQTSIEKFKKKKTNHKLWKRKNDTCKQS